MSENDQPGDQAKKADTQKRSSAALFAKFLKRLRRKGASGDAFTEAMRESVEDGDLAGRSRKDMILDAFGFNKLRVEDVMRPRADIVAIDSQATLGEAARLFADSQHSRLPVIGEALDDPMGLVHVRDLMSLLAPDDSGEFGADVGDRVLTRVKREILFVPPSMKLSSLLLRMQTSRIHMALVVDEYGGTDGLITMEDIVEQIIGEIDDEHDENAELVHERSAHVFEADGRAEINAIEAMMKISLALPDHEDEFDTVGGLAVALAGRVPQHGEILRHPSGLEIDILEANPRKVKRVRLRLGTGLASAAAAPAATQDAILNAHSVSPASNSPAAA